ncbi:MAG: diaminopimelate epimerase [Alphaproteobacteria bacterium]|nr:diaminopimelate epimerase [Alphaproteobacteria bacterium]
MHGLGNDFVVIDCRANDFVVTEKFLRATANRKRGVGCDQFVFLRKPKSPQADVFLEMYNDDTSVVRACGNATRCIASLMFKELGRNNCVIETVAGLLKAWEDPSGLIAVDFGEPNLAWDQIPLAHEADTLHMPLSYGGLSDPCCVNVGNSHAVFFVSDVNAVPLSEIGPRFERDPIFPDRCNIEIAQILAQDRIRMRVWERGTGITEACGSGALATLVAAVRRGLCARRATLVLDGGELIIEWRSDNHVLLIGAASLSFTGAIAENFGDDERAA